MNRYNRSKTAKLRQDWHKADIKAALEKAGWSLRRLAISHGYHPSMLIQALRRPYLNAERLIADALGLKPEAIWPSRYDQRRPFRGVGGAHTHNTGLSKPANYTTFRADDRNPKIGDGD